MLSIEFSKAEILHLYNDAPRTPMVGPRLTAWLQIQEHALEILKELPDDKA